MPSADAFADVLTANQAYAAGFRLAGLAPRAARGLAILTCMDSRIEPLAMLGLAPGDAKILRNAGGRVTDDVLRTLVAARYLLGVERVMVIAHTRCRMTAASDEELQRAIREAGGPDTSGLAFNTTPDVEAGVTADLARLRGHGWLADLVAGGFVYDVDTGLLRRVA